MLLVIDKKIYQEGGKDIFTFVTEHLKKQDWEIVPVSSFKDAAAERLIQQADALIIRTTLNANEKSLAQAEHLSFIGTATAGTDHLDIKYLKKRDIHWANAPGCNADAVADYVFSCLAITDYLLDIGTGNKSLGLIGHGQVGNRITGRLEKLAKASGGKAKIMIHDPFINEGSNIVNNGIFFAFIGGVAGLIVDGVRGGIIGAITSGIAGAVMGAWGNENSPVPYRTLKKVMQADCIVIACSLTKRPRDKASRWMLDESVLSKLSPHQLMINCARGEVLRENDLLKIAKQQETTNMPVMIMDVWDHEPNINPAVMELCAFATPHIAGYSQLGKQNALKEVAKEFYRHYSKRKIDNLEELREHAETTKGVSADAPVHAPAPVYAPSPKKNELPYDYLKRALLLNYNIAAESKVTKKVMLPNGKGASFTNMRNKYALRRQGNQWNCDKLPDPYQQMLKAVVGID